MNDYISKLLGMFGREQNLGMGNAPTQDNGMGAISGLMSNQQNPPGLMTDPIPGQVGGGLGGGDPYGGQMPTGSSDVGSGGDYAAANNAKQYGAKDIGSLLKIMIGSQQKKSPRERMQGINNTYLQGLMGG